MKTTLGALSLWLAATCVGCGARTALEDLDDAGAQESDVVISDANLIDAPVERCDGLDDDGDGRVDEGLPQVECGVGACRRSACDALRCIPGEPVAERCGGGDDDCDGVTDEELRLGALGPAVEVREGMGGYDSCGTCSWAIDPMLVPQEDGGVFVSWHHGISGGDEIPNMWGRLLDEDGQRVGEPESMGERVQLEGRRIPGLDPNEGLIFAIERVGSSDVGRIWRVSPRRVEQVETDFGRCSRATTMAYVDGHLVSSCIDRGEATFQSRRLGEPATTISLDVDDMLYGGVLHGRDGELLVAAYHVDVDRDDRWMSFARLSPTLEVLQPLTRSEAAYSRGEVAFATPEGWLWWNLNWPDEVQGQRLDGSGQVLGTTSYPFRASNPPLASVALGGGHHLVVLPARSVDEPLTLVRIDALGDVVQELGVEVPPNPASEPDFTAHIDVIEHRGAFWAAWAGSFPADGEANFVNVQRFGCVAP